MIEISWMFNLQCYCERKTYITDSFTATYCLCLDISLIFTPTVTVTPTLTLVTAEATSTTAAAVYLWAAGLLKRSAAQTWSAPAPQDAVPAMAARGLFLKTVQLKENPCCLLKMISSLRTWLHSFHLCSKFKSHCSIWNLTMINAIILGVFALQPFLLQTHPLAVVLYVWSLHLSSTQSLYFRHCQTPTVRHQCSTPLSYVQYDINNDILLPGWKPHLDTYYHIYTRIKTKVISKG